MSVHFDQDNGPGSILTEDHRYAIEEGIKSITYELGRCGPEHLNDLHRQRRHLVAELAAGMRLHEPDEDGDYITLTKEDRQHITTEIAAYDVALMNTQELSRIRELGRRQRHLNDELQAGRRLPLSEEEAKYDHEIVPRKRELGGGWRLYLIEDGQEVGGGVFPAESDKAAAAAWWDTLDSEQRNYWTNRGVIDCNGNAHLAFLRKEAWHDAADVAGEWLDSRPQD